MPALVEAALPAGGGTGEQIARQLQAAGARFGEGVDRAGQQLLQGPFAAAEEDVQMAGLRDALRKARPCGERSRSTTVIVSTCPVRAVTASIPASPPPMTSAVRPPLECSAIPLSLPSSARPAAVRPLVRVPRRLVCRGSARRPRGPIAGGRAGFSVRDDRVNGLPSPAGRMCGALPPGPVRTGSAPTAHAPRAPCGAFPPRVTALADIPS
ncbi:hypothetical protein GCM10012285_04040 [Streptomyces kronopolitis]|uniref:SPOR domain-containing protein n=1 Tax=Streptomyces kronopolitis TaxID=1612435 RepID=A0ABQ2IXX3_9ACTN|nr:hypothetical protein GCM10012285_04040 [Streptomyces kronopolitis]